MDYKEKYEQALKRAKELLEDMDKGDYFASNGDIENIFPELKESEDEQSKKWILEYLHDGLRKSDEQFKGQFKTAIAWLEKQDENNPTDKVEPKFKVGDWVVLTVGELSTTLQIVNVDTNKRLYWFNDSSYLPIVDEECLHYWTIHDAMDGDVLASKGKGGQEVGIVKRFIGKYGGYNKCFETYCYSDLDGTFRIGEYMGGNSIHPATKEQRDLLFQKMKEAGYEWDSEKKELKKIESKTLDADKVIAWLVGNICDYEYYVKWFKKDFGL